MIIYKFNMILIMIIIYFYDNKAIIFINTFYYYFIDERSNDIICDINEHSVNIKYDYFTDS